MLGRFYLPWMQKHLECPPEIGIMILISIDASEKRLIDFIYPFLLEFN